METADILERHFAPDPTFVVRHIAGEAIRVPARGTPGEEPSIYALNEVSDFIWAQIDGEKRVADIRDAIVAEFQVGPEQAEADLIGFLLQLEQVGAVRAQ
jgi:hypothetical protein